jgi:hypothetical protein
MTCCYGLYTKYFCTSLFGAAKIKCFIATYLYVLRNGKTIYGRCNENGVKGECRRFSEALRLLLAIQDIARALDSESSHLKSRVQSILGRTFRHKGEVVHCDFIGCRPVLNTRNSLFVFFRDRERDRYDRSRSSSPRGK